MISWLCRYESEDVCGQLSKFTALSLREGHVSHEGLTFELFDQPCEPVAFRIDIGVVDLIGITGEDNLCALSHPRDDGLHFQGS